MKSEFPHGFHCGFLCRLKVSCFLCGVSHEKTRKLWPQMRVNSGWKRFPLPGNFPGQETISFHFGFLMEGSL
jgi:hypothetical protein